MNDYDLAMKAVRVIRSCRTQGQLLTADRYASLVKERISFDPLLCSLIRSAFWDRPKDAAHE